MHLKNFIKKSKIIYILIFAFIINFSIYYHISNLELYQLSFAFNYGFIGFGVSLLAFMLFLPLMAFGMYLNFKEYEEYKKQKIFQSDLEQSILEYLVIIIGIYTIIVMPFLTYDNTLLNQVEKYVTKNEVKKDMKLFHKFKTSKNSKIYNNLILKYAKNKPSNLKHNLKFLYLMYSSGKLDNSNSLGNLILIITSLNLMVSFVSRNIKNYKIKQDIKYGMFYIILFSMVFTTPQLPFVSLFVFVVIAIWGLTYFKKIDDDKYKYIKLGILTFYVNLILIVLVEMLTFEFNDLMTIILSSIIFMFLVSKYDYRLKIDTNDNKIQK
jgi:hypothetical protein